MADESDESEDERSAATRLRLSQRYHHDSVAEVDEPPAIFWTETLKTVLLGTLDQRSPLQLFRGYEETIIQKIFLHIHNVWKSSVCRTLPSYTVGRIHAHAAAYELVEQGYTNQSERDIVPDPSPSDDMDESSDDEGGVTASRVASVHFHGCVRNCHNVGFRYRILGFSEHDRPRIAFSKCGKIKFPDPRDLNVNMMPFILGDITSLPKDLHPYYEACIAKCPVSLDEMGRVCYLTIQEGFVRAEGTQRRAGLHVEAPGCFTGDGKFVAGIEHYWGNGLAYTPDDLRGGLFMASNVDHTCAVYNALVDTTTGAVNPLGAMEELRRYLGSPTLLKANELVWLTDKTPHEALPQPEDGCRQFFRLVTSDITLWHAKHCTPNPNVPLPDHVEVVEDSKFVALDAAQSPD